MIPRLIAFTLTILGLWAFCHIILIGQGVNSEEPITGWRQRMKLKGITWYVWFLCLTVGLRVKVINADPDALLYKEYLGENYQRDFKIT
jgi:hypothetical protein